MWRRKKRVEISSGSFFLSPQLICSYQEKHAQDTARIFYSTYRYHDFMMEKYIPTVKQTRLHIRARDIRFLHSAFCKSVSSGSILHVEGSSSNAGADASTHSISVRNPYKCRLNMDWISSVV